MGGNGAFCTTVRCCLPSAERQRTVMLMLRSFHPLWEVLNGAGVDGVGVNLRFFVYFWGAFPCRVCILLVFFRSFFLRFSSLFFLGEGGFFVFRIFLLFSSSQENLAFSAHFQAVAVDCPSIFGYGKTCKNLPKK